MLFKTMGLEVRKIGDMQSLYAEVDLVLSKAKDVKVLALAQGLQKMFTPSKHFDICFIREASDLHRIVIDADRMRIYRMAHCMDWGEMTPEYRATLMAMVLDDFRSVLSGGLE